MRSSFLWQAKWRDLLVLIEATDFPTLFGRGRRATLHSTCISTLSRNISTTSLENCRSLGCARDDKGNGSASLGSFGWKKEQQVPPLRCAPVGMTKETAVPHLDPLAGRKNSRSLHFAALRS